MPVGPAHCASGAPICSEIPNHLAWGRKVPSIRSAPREGMARVLPVERLCTSRGDLRTRLPFRLKTIWRLQLKAVARKHKRLQTTHTTTALDTSHRPVAKPLHYKYKYLYYYMR